MGAEIKSSLVAKQRILTENENESTFNTWHQSIMFHIVMDSKFSRFADSEDLGKWKSTAIANRGFTNDAPNSQPAEKQMSAVQKAQVLSILLGSISSFAPIISNKFITEQAKSLHEIFDRLRSHYGIRITGSRILDLTQINLAPSESYETLWERLSSFIEDNLLKKDGDIKHLGVKIEQDEIPTPSLLNILVVIWLRAIHIELPNMVKQKFNTQLKYTTLYSIREDISDAIPSILADMNDREYTVNFTKGFKQRLSMKSSKNFKNHNQSSKFQSYKQKICCLCQAAGRQGFDTHYLSECKFLPPNDRKYMSNVRDIVVASESEYSTEDEEPSACAVSAPPTNKVDVVPSPILQTYVNKNTAFLTLDTGAQVNLISEKECSRLNLEVLPSLQKAAMADGVTPIPTVGEVLFKCKKSHHTLIFKGLVVKKLSCPILAGQPFLALNDVFTRASLKMIYVSNCCQFQSMTEPITHQNSVRLSTVLKSSKKICLLPGQDTAFVVPNELKNQPVAVEPRCIAASNISVPGWLKCQIVDTTANGEIIIKNQANQPVIIKKHEQIAQLRAIETEPYDENVPYTPAVNNISCNKGPFSADIMVDSGNVLSTSCKQQFHITHKEFDQVFSPDLGKYNGASGKFEHFINITSNLPIQRKGRNPVYNRNNLEELQMKIDELVSKGVLAKPEELGISVEYVSPSFLVKKPSGGNRLVTAFNQLTEYVKPQPAAMPNVDDVLRQIAQWRYIIKSDLTDAYYHIGLHPDSMRFTGIVSPFRGTFVYTRAVMGLPGSESSLECLLSRILGDLMMKGNVVKLADDLYVGSNTESDLLQSWREVLNLLQTNGLKLKPSKTVCCPESTIILGWLWKAGTITPTAHRLNTLSQCDLPDTVHKLRQFVGSYKALSKVLPYHSDR